MKTCSQCSEEQQLDQFYKDKKSADGLRASCKTCVAAQKRIYFEKHRTRELNKLKKWKQQNPQKVKEGNLRNLYGITAEQYSEMLLAQNNCCAICKCHKSKNVTDKRNDKVRNLAVDHDHKSKKIRGLLCYRCNIAVGMLVDSAERASNLVEYLKLHEKENL